MEKMTFDVSLEEAFDMGYDAWCNGKILTDCPYEFGTSQQFAWDAGFNKAESDTLRVMY